MDIPQTLLAKWILFVSLASIFNTVQCFLDQKSVLTKKIYIAQPNQVTPLMARMFGTWTLLSTIIRLYTAYNIYDTTACVMCLATFGIALFHFASEIWIFKTSNLSSKGVIAPLIIASTSIVWMYWHISQNILRVSSQSQYSSNSEF
ncbi:hypothetical protein MIR68_006238 [Amoeboaphelidium protococcarum]|nr:hypothetical protein MIR68_006238 [Amoeboaphelidium protococcarum]